MKKKYIYIHIYIYIYIILIQTEHKLRILKNGLKLIQIEYKLGIKL